MAGVRRAHGGGEAGAIAGMHAQQARETRTDRPSRGRRPVFLAGKRIANANSNRMMKRLNWRPQYDNLDKIITHALAWEKKLGRREVIAPPMHFDPAMEPIPEIT